MLSPIEDILEEAKAGRMFIMVDDENRENEGDLIVPAEFATPQAMNFMIRYCSGIICLAMTAKRAQQLALPILEKRHSSKVQAHFALSIEAREGVTTGVSAYDRATTIAVAIDPTKDRDDISTPGHMFPLIARDGGVLERPGHTEAAVDIARLAGLYPAAAICEVMNEDGTMSRLPDLIDFALAHGLKIASIADLIEYRKQMEVKAA